MPPLREQRALPARPELDQGDAVLPNTERLANEMLSLPMGPHITAARQDEVIAAPTAVLAPSAASAPRL